MFLGKFGNHVVNFKKKLSLVWNLKNVQRLLSYIKRKIHLDCGLFLIIKTQMLRFVIICKFYIAKLKLFRPNKMFAPNNRSFIKNENFHSSFSILLKVTDLSQR